MRYSTPVNSPACLFYRQPGQTIRRAFGRAGWFLTFVALLIAPAAFAGTPTTTTLAITAGGNPVTSVSPGTVVTLTATVKAGSTPVTPGLVNFCDATALHCTDIHVVGSAQLTSAGTAVVRFRPGAGSHSYKAVFVGTNANAASASAPSALAVTPQTAAYPTITVENLNINSSGTGTAVVQVSGLTPSPGATSAGPTGTVSFVDNTSNGSSVVDTLTLTPTTSEWAWQPSQNFGPGNPSAVTTADLNGDGIPDLALVSGSELFIYLGKGDGTFTAGPTFSIGNFHDDTIATADFNGDGIPDLVVAPFVAYNTVGHLLVFLGAGDGTFTAVASTPSVGVHPSKLVTGDFNNDGKADLAVMSEFLLGSDGTVTVLLGNGDGSFTVAAGVSERCCQLDMTAGDFNGDGLLDLAVVNGSLNIWLGKGDGSFTATQSITGVSSDDARIAVADFNGDGIADLILASGWIYIDPYNGEESAGGDLEGFTGNGDGSFTPSALVPGGIETGGQPSFLVVGDFNQDGIPDLATGILNFSNSNSQVYFGNEDGSFSYVSSAPEGESAAVADFNGDGLPDFAVANSLSINFTENQKTASGSTTITLPTPGYHSISAEYSGDSNYLPSTSKPNTVQYKEPTTTALTATPPNATTGQPVSLTAHLSPYAASSASTDGETVTFSISGGATIGTGTLSKGKATFVWPNPPNGTYTIKASYPGDVAFMSSSGTTTVVVSSLVYPTMQSPAAGSTLTGTGVSFSWNPGSYTTFRFRLGTTAGGSDIYDSGSTSQTSANLTNVPPLGHTVYATLSYTLNGTWHAIAASYVEAQPALTAPAPGSTFAGLGVTFTWNAASLTTFRFRLGSAAGLGDLFDTGSTSETSVFVTNLPTGGAPIYATLSYKWQAQWHAIAYTFIEAGTPTPPAMTSPAPGTTLSGSSVTFNWSAGTGPTAYQLKVGTTGAGSSNVFLGGSTTSLSAPVSGIPTNGQPVYVRLDYKTNGVWHGIDYIYTAQ